MPMTTHRPTVRPLKVLVTSVFLGLSAVSLSACTPWASSDAYHSAVMRGQIVSLEGNSGVICIGKHDNAQVGQVLDVIRHRPKHVGGRHGARRFERVTTGKVKVVRIMDEHYSEIELVSGEIRETDTVELKKEN